MAKETSLEKIHRWLSDGYKEVEAIGGMIEKVRLTSQEEKQYRDVAAFCEATSAPLNKASLSDELCVKLISRNDSAELVLWVQSANGSLRTITGSLGDSDQMSNEDLLIFAKSLYNCGVKSVSAVKIESYGDDQKNQNTDTIILDLPQPFLERKKIFAFLNKVSTQQHWEKQIDSGQRFLCLRWD